VFTANTASCIIDYSQQIMATNYNGPTDSLNFMQNPVAKV